MVRFRHVAVIAVLVCTLSLTGCVGLLGDDAGEQDDGDQIDVDEYDAEELRAEAAASMAEAETYTFTTEQEFEVEETESEYSGTLEASGTADHRADLTHFDLTTTLVSSDGTPLSVQSTIYVSGDRVHEKLQDNPWGDRTLEEPWSAAGQETALLEDAEASIAGNDTVNGHETIALEVDASDEAIATYGFDPGPASDLRPDDRTVESATVTLYVGTEAPHYVYRSEVEMTVSGGDEAVQNVDATYTTTYGGFGEDVDVELPEEVRG